MVVIAKVDVVVAARWAQGLVGELLEGREVAAALVGIAVGGGGGGEVLDGRVAADAVLAAEVLVHGAVDVGDDDGLGGLELVRELVPSRFHRFAVASPRGKELNKGALARNCGVKVGGGELNGSVGTGEGGGEGDGSEGESHCI